MELVYKRYVPGTYVNGNGAAMGCWIFEQFDDAGVIFMDEKFLNELEPVFIVTNSSEMKFKKEIFSYGHIEIYAKCTNATPARIDVYMELFHRLPKNLSQDDTKMLATTATFSYTLLDKKNRKIRKLPKHLIEKACS